VSWRVGVTADVALGRQAASVQHRNSSLGHPYVSEPSRSRGTDKFEWEIAFSTTGLEPESPRPRGRHSTPFKAACALILGSARASGSTS
jgi:hypothetical protein